MRNEGYFVYIETYRVPPESSLGIHESTPPPLSTFTSH